MYIKSSLQYNVLDLKLNVNDCESLFIEVDVSIKSGPKTPLLVGCVYRHPRPSTKEFTEELTTKLTAYSDKNMPIYITGDINIDTSQQNNDGVMYYNNMLSSIGCRNLLHLILDSLLQAGALWTTSSQTWMMINI